RYHSRTVEFQFVLVVLFVAALMTEQAGLHYVVGAFLAGLAINATLPHSSAVTGHVLFVGESFFIPVFLMFSGMMTDPTAFIGVGGGGALLVSTGITVVAYTSKWLAAWLVGRIFHYSRDEQYTAFGLSHAQAAVTVPTLLIGLQAGLFSETVFNGAILMILLTSITSPLVVNRFAPRLRAHEAEPDVEPLFTRVLVPIANPSTQEHLITLAGILARESHGTVLALHVANDSNGRIKGLEHQRQLLERVPKILDDPEADIQLMPRVDTSVVKGILHAAVESQASAIVMGWRGRAILTQSILGSQLDEVVWRAPVPVLVGRMTTPMNAVGRVMLVFPPGHLNPVSITGSLQVAQAMAEALNVPLLLLGDEDLQAAVADHPALAGFRQPLTVQPLGRRLVDAVVTTAHANDLIVVPMLGRRKRFQSPLGDIPEHLAAATQGSILVVHYPL
ncbi:MAG TPA: cation:proton antiporter, partial [Anaerolineaceae bacterium]|nr:cation:proton antiporter [Anaerolineaceae bacterium]